MSLTTQRHAIRPLLNERVPADALAAYFAFYHPDDKTQIVTYPPEAKQAKGYICLSRTGMDLFRPLLTLRLPEDDWVAGAALIHHALPDGAAVILNTPPTYTPLIQALFNIQVEERLRLYVLQPERFAPVINVLVVQEFSPNEYPRFVIRHQDEGDARVVAAAAGLNWLSSYYGEISVTTHPQYRRRGWGRSVVAAVCQYLLDNGRLPLYVVSAHNDASIQLAESLGFFYSGIDQVLIQGTLKPAPTGQGNPA